MEKLYENYLNQLFSSESFWQSALKDTEYSSTLAEYLPYYPSTLDMVNDLKKAFALVKEIKDWDYKCKNWDKLYDKNAKKMKKVIAKDKTLQGKNPYDFYQGFSYFELHLTEKLYELSEMGWIGFMVKFDFLTPNFIRERFEMTDFELFSMYFATDIGCDDVYKEISPHIKDKILINGRWALQRDRMISDHLLCLRITYRDHKIDVNYDTLAKVSAFLGLSPKAMEFISTLDYLDLEDYQEFIDSYKETFIESDMLALYELIPK